jgi:acyl-CoA hydrolase
MKFKGNKIEAVHSFTVMPKDCNFNTNSENQKNDILFGGKLLFEIDYAGAKIARRSTYDVDSDMIVTASIDRINFEKPAYLGDIVTMVATIKSLGKSSISIRVKVNRESKVGEIEQICSATMTFVTIKDGKSIPHHLNLDKLSDTES